MKELSEVEAERRVNARKRRAITVRRAGAADKAGIRRRATSNRAKPEGAPSRKQSPS